jgi:hypothetical protein
MAHFAKVLDGKVVDVIVADQDFMDNYVDTTPGTWLKTSYNTRGGIHYEAGTNHQTQSSDQSKALRKNFAGIGWNYDEDDDAFYAPQEFSSWTLNTTTYLWEPPVTYPTDGELYEWNEETQTWDAVE